MPNYVIVNGELYHHGIKGMKWGVRRYQNKDGTLTLAGRKRYSETVANAKSAVNTAKSEQKAAYKAYSKAINRYNLIPTIKNYQKVNESLDQLTIAQKAYKQANMNYKVVKMDEDGGFDPSKKKSNHQTRLEEKYQKQGYTAKEATVLARDRIRTEKVLAAAAAVTVTACAAYAANKYVKNRTDQIIKSGSTLQRIKMSNSGDKLHDVFYSSANEHDNKRYEGVLGWTRKQQTGKAYLMKMEVGKDIKVASKEKAAKTFGDLYKNDSDFRNSVKDVVSQHFGGKNKVDVNNLNDRNIRKMYDNFNSGLIHIRDSGSGADKKFYNALKSAGYDAIQDINDMNYSGYNAKNPLIVFNHSKDSIMVKSVTEMTKAGGGKMAVEMGKSCIEEMGKLLASPYAVAATTGAAATMYVSDHVDADKKKQKS